MNRLKIFALVTALAVGLAMAVNKADAAWTSGVASVDAMSSYIWRGFELHEDTAIQPSAGITYGGFGITLWSDIDTETDEITETDVTLNYSFAIERIGIDIGYIYYGLEGFDDTQEIYVSAGLGMVLVPSLTVYYDFDEGGGGFVVASIGHDLEVYDDIYMSLGASASYNMESEYAVGDYSEFHNAEITASLSVPVSEGISITPVVAYSTPLSDEAEDAIENADGDSSFFYGGLNLSLNF